MVKWVLAIAAATAAIAGCASRDSAEYLRDGQRYGVTEGVFRGRWWSYYERGVSFMNGKFHEEAAADFQTAMINRSRDSWRARTYGLHFVNYFPNRELGIVYFHQGRYAEAVDTLEKALAMVDTARGHFYLGRAKEAMIAQGLLEDQAAPSVGTDMQSSTLLADHVLPLRIMAADDIGVAEVRLNERALPQRKLTEEVSFLEQLVLSEGDHALDFAVTDLADKTHAETLAFTVDLTGPTIGLFAPIDAMVVEETFVRIEGVCVDLHGVAEISVNRVPLAQGDGAERLPFETQVALQPGENRILLIARDMAGNETYSQVLVYQGGREEAAACLWLLKQRAPELIIFAQDGGPGALPTPPEAADRIVLKSPRPDRPNRHDRAVRVAGEVIASAGVSSLAINDAPFEQLTGAPKEVFSRRVPIADDAVRDAGGQMQVSVHAVDKEGRQLDETVEVELRPVNVDIPESRMPVAVLAFEGHGVDAPVSAEMRLALDEKLIERKRFRAVDRTQLEAVLTEQELASALSNPNDAIQLGRLTSAQIFLVGDVFARDEGVEVKVRIINTETSEVVSIIDGFASARNQQDLAAAGELLATELERVYPRLSGELLAIRERAGNKDVYFDWTREDGVQPGAYAMIFHETPGEYDEELAIYYDPVYTPVGRARIEEVSDNNCRARPVTNEQEEEIALEQGMAAVTM